MSKNHTQGTWTPGTSAVYDTVTDPDGELICFMSIRDNSKANARLIATAPDLLEFLEIGLREYGDKFPFYKKARALISQARGQS